VVCCVVLCCVVLCCVVLCCVVLCCVVLCCVVVLVLVLCCDERGGALPTVTSQRGNRNRVVDAQDAQCLQTRAERATSGRGKNAKQEMRTSACKLCQSAIASVSDQSVPSCFWSVVSGSVEYLRAKKQTLSVWCEFHLPLSPYYVHPTP
jgi:hypothetical protein